MKRLAAAIKGNRMQMRETVVKVFSFSALLILLIVIFSLFQKNFLGTANLRTLLSDSAPLMVMSAGMTMILLLGSIDLSMGSVCSVANVLVVIILRDYGHISPSPAVVAVAALIFVAIFGSLSGVLLGLVHVKFKVPSFIASLGFMSVWQSVALLLSEAPIAVPKSMWGAIEWFRVSFGVVGLPLVLSLAALLLSYFLASHTIIGKSIYAIGGNERAARIAGIKVDRIKVTIFSINGVCAALGGFFLAAKLRSSAPTVGDSFTLLIVAAIVLGGSSLLGGSFFLILLYK